MRASAARDVVSGIVFLAFAVWLFWLAGDLRGNPLVPIGPGFYPRIVLGATALLGAAVALSGVFAARAESEAAPSSPANWRLVALTFATFGVYIGLLPGLGFRIATFLFVAALQAVIQPPRGRAEWLILGIVAFGTTLVTYLAFEVYLTVLLPRGTWTDM